MGACRQILAGQMLVVLFVSVLQSTCSAATSRALPGIVGVWDRSNATWNSLYPASLFRDDSVRGYFDIWPEDNSLFRFTYYCEDPVKGSLSLRNFTYSTIKGRLVRVPYYDLGIVQPYWKNWLFGKVKTKRISYPINCEYNDLSGLYSYRYFGMAMKDGCVAAAVMLGIIQIIVAIVVTAMWGWRFLRCSRAQMRAYLKVWFWNSQWGDFFSEIACCWMDPANIVKFELLRQQSVLTIHGPSSLRVLLQGLYDDWVWQRVMGQLMVLVPLSCLSLRLPLVDDLFGGRERDQMVCMLFTTLVVSGTWSFGAAALIMIHSISHTLAQTFPFAKCGPIRRVSTDDGCEGNGGEALPRTNAGLMRSQSHEPNSESGDVLPPFPSKARRSENIDEIIPEVHVEEQPQEQEQCTEDHMHQEYQILVHCMKITRFQVCVRAAVGFFLWFTFWFFLLFGFYIYNSYNMFLLFLMVMTTNIGVYCISMHNHIFTSREIRIKIIKN